MPRQKSPGGRHKPQGLEILYEDRDILVVDKAPGLLTVGTDSEKERTAYYRLTNYVRKGCARSRNRIFIVHRLDREVSGILVFAKNIEAKEHLQRQWDDAEKRYLAVVFGWLNPREGTLTSYLIENKAHVVRSTSDRVHGKLSHTAYRVLRESAEYSLVEVALLTGRKHQIRVHLSENGNPIVGDKKYGGGDGAHHRVALHAISLALYHPYTGEWMTFETRPPSFLYRLMG